MLYVFPKRRRLRILVQSKPGAACVCVRARVNAACMLVHVRRRIMEQCEREREREHVVVVSSPVNETLPRFPLASFPAYWISLLVVFFPSCFHTTLAV